MTSFAKKMQIFLEQIVTAVTNSNSRGPERLFVVINQQSIFYAVLWFGRHTCSAKTDFKLLR